MKRQFYNYAFLAVVLFVGANIATAFDSENELKKSFVKSPAQNFYGKNWRLTKIEGVAPETDKASIKFERKNSSMNGYGGCNHINGKITKRGNRIKFTALRTTLMACQKGLTDERNFMEKLKRVNKYKLENGKLLLMEDEKVLLEFESE